MSRNLAKLPKAHLHIHLIGALTKNVYQFLFKKNVIENVNVIEIPEKYENFKDFNNNYYKKAKTCIQTEEDLCLLIHDLIKTSGMEGKK